LPGLLQRLNAARKQNAAPVQFRDWLAAATISDVLLRNPLDVRLTTGVAPKATTLVQEAGRVLDDHTQQIFKGLRHRFGPEIIVMAIGNLTRFIAVRLNHEVVCRMRNLTKYHAAMKPVGHVILLEAHRGHRFTHFFGARLPFY
jgi:hypothetical protein